MNQIHPTVVIGPNVEMGDNNYIGPFCIIGFPAEHRGYWPTSGKVVIGNNCIITGLVTIDAGTENTTVIGNDVMLMKHSHVGHDASIGNKVMISPGAKIGGHAVIGEGCNIGLNASIHQRQIIKEGCMIGANAFVSKTLVTEPYSKYAGVPARCIGKNAPPRKA